MTTIHDVAAYAKVSASTVSHVMNGTRFVDPQTEERVRDAIEVLGYRPNSVARSLRRRQTSTIGLVIPDNSNPFFADLARSIEDAGFVEGYNVILCNSDSSEVKEAAYVDVLLSKQIDGLILIPSGHSTEPLKAILNARVPVVIVDRAMPDLSVDQVLIDNEQGGYLAGQYLLSLGHREIGCLTGPMHLRVTSDRLNGFRRALRDAGTDLPDEAIVEGGFAYNSGETAISELLNRNSNLTAVFAMDDLMAIGAISALRRAYLSVPDDISIIGFDNISQASLISPSLTTIAQPVLEMGRMSVSILLERIKGHMTPPSQLLLPTTLVERESCAPRNRPASGILHRRLAQIVSSLKDGESLLLSDAHFPTPRGVPSMDLAVVPGVPSLTEVYQAIAAEIHVQRVVAVSGQGSPQMPVETISEDLFWTLSRNVRAVVRSGESAARIIIYVTPRKVEAR